MERAIQVRRRKKGGGVKRGGKGVGGWWGGLEAGGWEWVGGMGGMGGALLNPALFHFMESVGMDSLSPTVNQPHSGEVCEDVGMGTVGRLSWPGSRPAPEVLTRPGL